MFLLLKPCDTVDVVAKVGSCSHEDEGHQGNSHGHLHGVEHQWLDVRVVLPDNQVSNSVIAGTISTTNITIVRMMGTEGTQETEGV